MVGSITKGGMIVIVPVLGVVYKKVRSWLYEQAAKNETPLDEWVLGLIDKLLEIPVDKPA